MRQYTLILDPIDFEEFEKLQQKSVYLYKKILKMDHVEKEKHVLEMNEIDYILAILKIQKYSSGYSPLAKKMIKLGTYQCDSFMGKFEQIKREVQRFDLI